MKKRVILGLLIGCNTFLTTAILAADSYQFKLSSELLDKYPGVSVTLISSPETHSLTAKASTKDINPNTNYKVSMFLGIGSKLRCNQDVAAEPQHTYILGVKTEFDKISKKEACNVIITEEQGNS